MGKGSVMPRSASAVARSAETPSASKVVLMGYSLQSSGRRVDPTCCSRRRPEEKGDPSETRMAFALHVSVADCPYRAGTPASALLRRRGKLGR